MEHDAPATAAYPRPPSTTYTWPPPSTSSASTPHPPPRILDRHPTGPATNQPPGTTRPQPRRIDTTELTTRINPGRVPSGRHRPHSRVRPGLASALVRLARPG